MFHPENKGFDAPIVTNVVARSFHHRACGYLAGLHSYQPQGETSEAEFESFESAWEAIQSVLENLLNDFEDELWETQSRRFVYGTKQVSVIDEVKSDQPQSKEDAKVIRYLVLNERPNLIQTAVQVSDVGAPYEHYYFDENKQKMAKPPSPIAQTHLGGLAMTLPLWYRANDRNKKPCHPPNCLLLGAGGCSLAHTLAANLFHGESYENVASSSRDRNGENPDLIGRPGLTAVEACPEILLASKLWFGAGPDDEAEFSKKMRRHGLEPPFFDLIESTGELYLESLVKSFDTGMYAYDSHSPDSIDVLIIDAEDGSAPPQSMRTHEFWSNFVLPSLGRSPVIGVNSIGTNFEKKELVSTMEQVFGGDYIILVVAPPPEAMVTDRHELIFVLPQIRGDNNGEVANWSLTTDELTGHVDAPEAWAKATQIALENNIS